MALRIWLPLNGDVKNQGLSDDKFTVSGATVNASGKIGKCYYYNGSSHSIYTNREFDYPEITITCWFKIESSNTLAGTQWLICFNKSGAGTAANTLAGLYVNTQLKLVCQCHGHTYTYNTELEKNVWYHVCVTSANGEVMKLYIDGQLVSEDTTVGTAVTATCLSIGGRASNSAGTLHAYSPTGMYINDVRIYDTILSPLEIKHISQGLVLHYPLSGPAPEQLFGEVTEDNVIYSIRQSPDKHGAYDSIVGASVGWNQLINPVTKSFSGVNFTENNGKYTISGTATSSGGRNSLLKDVPIISNHKYFSATTLDLTNMSWYITNMSNTSTYISLGLTNSKKETIVSATYTGNAFFGCNLISGVTYNTSGYIYLTDLTAMFGTAIADRAYTLEQSSAGSGVTWLKSQGFFTQDYYPYNPGQIKNVEGLVKREITGFNQWDEQWEVGNINATTGEDEQNNSVIRSVGYTKAFPNTTYYVSAPEASVIFFYDAEKNFIDCTTRQNQTFTTPSDTLFIRFRMSYSYGATYKNDICINISNPQRNGEYEPYISHTYSYTNPPTLRGVYKLDSNNNIYADGDIWDSNGNIKRSYAVMVLDGTNQKFSGSFGLQDSGNYVVYKTMPVNRTSYTICDRFEYSTYGISTMPLYSYVGGSGAITTWSFALPNTITSLNEANAWLVNNPVTIIYKLATPTTETSTKFTNPQIIEPYGTEAYSFTGLIPPGHITKYIDIEVEGGNYTYDESLTNMGMTDNIEYDVSGYGYNGTRLGALTYSSDTPRYTMSANFNGTDSGILIENLPLSNIINTAVTYSFWIKPSGENGGRSVYFGSYYGTSWSIEKTTGNLIRGYWNGNPDVAYSGTNISDGAWQHVCITKNGASDIKVYINGVLKGTSTTAHNTLTFPTTYRIGRDTRSGDGTPYKGLMSDFRIYATALSVDDIIELYHTPVTLSNNGTLMTQGEYVEV